MKQSWWTVEGRKSTQREPIHLNLLSKNCIRCTSFYPFFSSSCLISFPSSYAYVFLPFSLLCTTFFPSLSFINSFLISLFILLLPSLCSLLFPSSPPCVLPYFIIFPSCHPYVLAFLVPLFHSLFSFMCSSFFPCFCLSRVISPTLYFHFHSLYLSISYFYLTYLTLIFFYPALFSSFCLSKLCRRISGSRKVLNFVECVTFEYVCSHRVYKNNGVAGQLVD